MEIPPGTLIFEDPPIHNIHRNLLSRLFTPRKVAALEPQIREFTARCLDPLVGTGRFDFVNDLGEQMPMRVIGMLLGIPEGQATRDHRSRRGDPAEGEGRRAGHRRGVRGVHRLADRTPVGRHHDRPAQRRVRGRDRHPAAAAARRVTAVSNRDRDGGLQRDDDPADRLGGEDPGRVPRSAPRARREPGPDPAGDRGDSALGAAGVADRPLRHPRRRVLRADGARRVGDADAGRRRQPRPPPVRSGRRRVRHPPRTEVRT